MEENGKLIVLSAPSGSGKTTIVHHLLKSGLPLEFSVSACSREKRGNEADGKDYYFLSKEEFKKRIDNKEFLEWEEVYQGSYYGTLLSEVERIWKLGKHVIFDVDVVGGLNIKRKIPDRCLSMFIMPPSVEELEKRLRHRSTDDEQAIKMRVGKAMQELEYSSHFDVVVVNDKLETATKEAEELIRNFIES